MAKKTNQDETVLDVEELYSKSEKFVDDNKKQLSLGLGAVAALILVVIGYSSLIVGPKNQAAEEASFMAEHYFSKDSADLAMLGDGLSAGLEEVLNDHSGTLLLHVPPSNWASCTATPHVLTRPWPRSTKLDSPTTSLAPWWTPTSATAMWNLATSMPPKATSPLLPARPEQDWLPMPLPPCAPTSKPWS